jgi:hypothetical protein
MKSIRFALGSFLSLMFLTSVSLANSAGRTFVSGHGSDSNPCSLTAPCRTLAAALAQTAPGGEVIAIDSAGYGPFTINQGVTVQAAPGVYAGITAGSGDAIDIKAGARDKVILRGLTLNSLGTAGNGITFSTGEILQAESCAVNGFSVGSGLLHEGGAFLEVKDSVFTGNLNGILTLAPSADEKGRRRQSTGFALLESERVLAPV